MNSYRCITPGYKCYRPLTKFSSRMEGNVENATSVIVTVNPSRTVFFLRLVERIGSPSTRRGRDLGQVYPANLYLVLIS